MPRRKKKTHEYDDCLALFFKYIDKPLELKSLLCIDPGLEGTGWAYWEDGLKRIHPPSPPTNVGIIRAKRGSHWMEKIYQIRAQFQEIIGLYDTSVTCIEFQELWGSSAISQASAGTGALFKLTMLAGQLAMMCDMVTTQPNPILMVPPSLWKGQLSKGAINIRIKRALDLRYPDHISDAVGIGLAVQGVL